MLGSLLVVLIYLERANNTIIGQGYLLTLCIVDYGVYGCIHQFGISYVSLGNLKKLSGYQRYQQTSPTCSFQIDWFETMENRSDSKSISDSGVCCNER